MKWAEIVFYGILLIILSGSIEGLIDLIKLWINRRYDYKNFKRDSED